MRILREPLNLIDAHDIQQLWADGVSEGTEVELKADLPNKAGLQQDPWYQGKSFSEHARNQIAEEIIAFANTLGGVVCVGINETADHPKRAASPNPLPRVHELARRLRQAVYDVIDPPLAVLEAIGIELSPGDGVVLLRAPQSRRRPHRHNVNKEVYVRREDETARVSMREIQELTIQSIADATRIETTISERRAEFLKEAGAWHGDRMVHGERRGGALHLLGVPTTPVDLVRVAGRQDLTGALASVSVTSSNGEQIDCTWPYATHLLWRTGLRSIFAEDVTKPAKGVPFPERKTRYLLQTNGVCELSHVFQTNDSFPYLYAGWMAGALGFMLGWIERVRRMAGTFAEYALAIEFVAYDRPVRFPEYGAHSLAFSRGTALPMGEHVFPVASIGSTNEFPSHLARFDEDLWNLAGQDTQQWAPSTFSVQL